MKNLTLSEFVQVLLALAFSQFLDSRKDQDPERYQFIRLLYKDHQMSTQYTKL